MYTDPAIANVDGLNHHFLGRLEICDVLLLYTLVESAAAELTCQRVRGRKHAGLQTDACKQAYTRMRAPASSNV
jgi:hypothetical protein